MKQHHYNFQHHSIHRNIPLRITHMNLYHCQCKIDHFINSHTYPKMIVILSGSCIFSIDQNPVTLDKMDALFINKGTFKYSLECSTSSVDLLIIGFESIDFLFSQEENTMYCKRYLSSEKCQNILRNIHSELIDEERNYQYTCELYTNLLMVELQRHYNIKYQINTNEKVNNDCEIIRNYIDEHFADNLTLEELSKISSMNKYYLVHSFTNTYGCSPINYLNEKKIEESKLLLKTTNHSIAEIANIMGFSSQSYFSQSFKKHTYMTPNEYRRSVK